MPRGGSGRRASVHPGGAAGEPAAACRPAGPRRPAGRAGPRGGTAGRGAGAGAAAAGARAARPGVRPAPAGAGAARWSRWPAAPAAASPRCSTRSPVTNLAPTGVRRPTTSRARAAIWPGADELAPLLGLAGRARPAPARPGRRRAARRRAARAGPDRPARLRLHRTEHRLEAERLTGVVDLLVWVLDPQKYADAALHERYLRPLATHRDVMLVALNQADRLGPTRPGLPAAPGCTARPRTGSWRPGARRVGAPR